ncbi:hypothetical protein ACWGDE_01665 [Streptomyces sp. NPDC054956]
MSTVATAMAKARSFLAFIGVLALLGSDWSTWERISLGLALVVMVAIGSSADGHRIWPHTLKRPTRFDTAA